MSRSIYFRKGVVRRQCLEEENVLVVLALLWKNKSGKCGYAFPPIWVKLFALCYEFSEPAIISPAESHLYRGLLFFLESLLPLKGEASHEVVTLPHPRAGTPALFLRSEGRNQYFEIVKFAEKTRSWFLGNTVESDGELYIVTAVNPVYFAIYYLQKNDKFRPLDDIFDDRDFPQARGVRSWCEKPMSRVAESKSVAAGTLQVYRLDAEKTISWLVGRVRRLVDALQTHRVCSGSSADLIRSENDDDDAGEYTRCAYSIVADYVPRELGGRLKSALGLDAAPRRKSEPRSEDLPPAKRQKSAPVKPVEDYANGDAKKKMPRAPATKKMDTTGMRSIASFFGKK